MVKDFDGIKRAAYSYFQDLYSVPEEPTIGPHAYPIDLIPKCVHDSDNAMLTAPINMDELKKVLDNMEPDKAPGPNGFSVRFLLTCWSTIKKRFIENGQKVPELC